MTVAVGYKRAVGTIWLGADSRVVGGDHSISSVVKVVRLGPRVGYAFAGDVSVAQAVEQAWRAGTWYRSDIDFKAAACDFILPSLEKFRRRGDADFVWAINGQLGEAYGDLSYCVATRAYAAVGSGAPYALGSFHTQTSRNPVVVVEAALTAAVEHDAHCGGDLLTVSFCR